MSSVKNYCRDNNLNYDALELIAMDYIPTQDEVTLKLKYLDVALNIKTTKKDQL